MIADVNWWGSHLANKIYFLSEGYKTDLLLEIFKDECPVQNLAFGVGGGCQTAISFNIPHSDNPFSCYYKPKK